MTDSTGMIRLNNNKTITLINNLGVIDELIQKAYDIATENLDKNEYYQSLKDKLESLNQELTIVQSELQGIRSCEIDKQLKRLQNLKVYL